MAHPNGTGLTVSSGEAREGTDNRNVQPSKSFPKISQVCTVWQRADVGLQERPPNGRGLNHAANAGSGAG